MESPPDTLFTSYIGNPSNRANIDLEVILSPTRILMRQPESPRFIMQLLNLKLTVRPFNLHSIMLIQRFVN